MTTLTDEIAAEIAAVVVERGYSTCTADDVRAVQRHGSVDESTVGDEYDDELTEAIIDQLDERGIEVA